MKIEHIALYAQDLEGAKQFFETYFEAKAGDRYRNQKTGFCSYFLSFSDGARLEIMTRPEVLAREKTMFDAGLIHLAFSVGSKAAVDSLTSRLAADGYAVVSGPRTTGDGYYESCVSAFEGNLIEITV